MTAIDVCIPCQYGDHDGHQEVIQAVPEGMIGGAVCGCRGECRAQPITWREALEGSFAAVDAAYARRTVVVKAAHDAGLSLRAIAEVVGISAAGVHRIIGKAESGPDAAAILDSPARP